MSDGAENKKKNFMGSLKAAFRKVTTRKYSKNDLKKLWDVAKHTGAEFSQKPLREAGLFLTAVIVPGAGFAWAIYRLKRYADRNAAANDNQKSAAPDSKAARRKKKPRPGKSGLEN